MHGGFKTLEGTAFVVAPAQTAKRNRTLKLKPDAMKRLAGSVAFQPKTERVSLHRFSTSFAGSCMNPIWFDAASPGERMPVQPVQVPGFAPETGDPHRRVCVNRVELAVRCRKCPACRKWRCHCWQGRMLDEMRYGARTWFCTYTLKEGVAHLLLLRAIQRYEQRGGIWEQASPHEKFRAHCREMGVEFQKYLKRLRREGLAFRYVRIFEPQGKGTPHIHALVIEESYKSTAWGPLNDEWAKAAPDDPALARFKGYGFAKIKLVEDERKAARYVTKYMFKDVAQTKVAASLQFGDPLGAIKRRLERAYDKKHISPLMTRYVPIHEQANDGWMYGDREVEAELARFNEASSLVKRPAAVDAGKQAVGLPVDASFESERVRVHRQRSVLTPGGGLSLALLLGG